ncbi:MAG: DUF4446 family protein [Candidatus Moranbacteria bacterium]|nr:DUF4446 family protein [Candidatus Moranbacteria bacterium]
MEIFQNPFLWIGVLAFSTVLLFAISFSLSISLRRLKKFSDVFFSGTQAKNFETLFLEHIKHSQKIEKDLNELAHFSNKVYDLAGKGVYKIGLIRFNPFKDVGGNQSFALALLDQEKTGVVISSLYTREGTRIYTKPVYKGDALEDHSFTEEEKEAIKKANSKKIDGFTPSNIS